MDRTCDTNYIRWPL